MNCYDNCGTSENHVILVAKMIRNEADEGNRVHWLSSNSHIIQIMCNTTALIKTCKGLCPGLRLLKCFPRHSNIQPSLEDHFSVLWLKAMYSSSTYLSTTCYMISISFTLDTAHFYWFSLIATLWLSHLILDIFTIGNNIKPIYIAEHIKRLVWISRSHR